MPAAVRTQPAALPSSTIFLPSVYTAQPVPSDAQPSSQPVASTSAAVTLPLRAASPAQNRLKKRKSASHVVINGQLQDSDSIERKYVCTYEDCGKAYNRPARLEEHLRSHTDERPYVCNECGSSYRRETHLSTHMRTHRPESERPLACTSDGCSKRFWTKQHLKRHVAITHLREKEYQCTECHEAFAKGFQLRAHVAAIHRPEGTLPNICDHPGCDKSFPAPSQLRTHKRTHESKTYSCAHETCINRAEGAPVFPNWSALQKHIKADHPPTCTHPECHGQTFSTTAHLRRHLTSVHHEAEELQEGEQPGFRFRRKRYSRAKMQEPEAPDAEQHESDAPAEEIEEEEPQETENEKSEVEHPHLEEDDKMIDSDCEMPWHCIEDACERSFASAVDFHAHVSRDHAAHPTRKTLACSFPACTFTARKQHALERHLSSVHPNRSALLPSLTFVQDDFQNASGSSALDMLTGRNYGQDLSGVAVTASPTEEGQEGPAKKKRRTLPLRFGCPATDESGQMVCQQRFWRVYDVERHLKRNHDMDLTRTEVEGLLGVESK